MVNHLSAFVEVEEFFGLSVVLECMRSGFGSRKCFVGVRGRRQACGEMAVVVLEVEVAEELPTS